MLKAKNESLEFVEFIVTDILRRAYTINLIASNCLITQEPFDRVKGASMGAFLLKKMIYPARARSARARRACALRALGLLLADGTPTGGRGEDFLSRQPDFFTETAVTPERKVEKSFPRWEINRHDKG